MSMFDRPRDNIRWPTRVRDLRPAEQFVVSSFRRWIVGWTHKRPDQWVVVGRDFTAALGASEGRVALSSFVRLVNTLRLHACRAIQHHQPCCPCLGPDEACLTLLIAACQHGDSRLARASAGWLVGKDAVVDLIESATFLAEAMRARGLLLPQRARAPRGHVVADAVSTVVVH